jgi:hypothetical protein
MVIVAVDPIHGDRFAGDEKAPGTLEHLAVAEHQVTRRLAHDHESGRAPEAIPRRAATVTPFRDPVGVRPVKPFNVVGDTILDHQAAVAAVDIGHHQSLPGVAH